MFDDILAVEGMQQIAVLGTPHGNHQRGEKCMCSILTNRNAEADWHLLHCPLLSTLMPVRPQIVYYR